MHDYPHLAIIDPRTGRLMWRKEGWTQQNPMTAESFAEIAMDFCSRNSFDRPPTAPRPPNGAAASRPTKRPMHEMSEDEQLQAAMRASLQDSNHDKDETMEDGNDEVEVLGTSTSEDGKQPATTETIETEETSGSGSSFMDELVALDIGEEPSSGPKIQFRMPDGKRKIRKFASSDSVKNLYAFVAVCALYNQHDLGLYFSVPLLECFLKMNLTMTNCFSPSYLFAPLNEQNFY